MRYLFIFVYVLGKLLYIVDMLFCFLILVKLGDLFYEEVNLYVY